MGTSGAFIAICVGAIAQGGPAMLATQVVISSLFQFLLAWRLSLLRRILTPTVSGTVIMLIPVTVMPIVFDMLTHAPEGTPALAAPLSALVTALVICAISLKAQGVLHASCATSRPLSATSSITTRISSRSTWRPGRPALAEERVDQAIKSFWILHEHEVIAAVRLLEDFELRTGDLPVHPDL